MTIIGLKELRQNAKEIADRALNGESFMVVRRSKPVFQITPPQEEADLKATSMWVDGYIKDNRKLLETLAKK